ncbi:hypothetical protein AB0M36_08055 [Actinoplanes sp. NPDC051346]|uniref:hypothetical protein n=1 Tax=Actinoplanes sp. NPDC051346 TaxID=3155048 RepID=UPI0034163F87
MHRPKSLVTMALAAVAAACFLIGTPATAVAGPRQAAPALAAAKLGFGKAPATTTGKGIPMSGFQTNLVQGSCNVFIPPGPVYYVDFVCNITAGAVRLFIVCNDNVTYWSPVVTGQQDLRGICGPPGTVIQYGGREVIV